MQDICSGQMILNAEKIGLVPGKDLKMRYRKHAKTGDRISEIGLGSAYLYKADHHEAIATLRAAYEGGINYYDLAAEKRLPCGARHWQMFGNRYCIRFTSARTIPMGPMAGH